MQTQEITLKVDAQVAKTFRNMPLEQQTEIGELIGLLLRTPSASEKSKALTSLKKTIRKASKEAKENRLTPEILNQILDES